MARYGDQVARDDVRMSAEAFSQCLEAQAAAIARRQGPDVGVDPETMRTRVRSGRWQRLQRGVYAAFSGDPADEQWRDKRRDNAHAVQGIVTLRFGLLDLGDRSCQTAADVAAVLRWRGWKGDAHPCSRLACALRDIRRLT